MCNFFKIYCGQIENFDKYEYQNVKFEKKLRKKYLEFLAFRYHLKFSKKKYFKTFHHHFESSPNYHPNN